MTGLPSLLLSAVLACLSLVFPTAVRAEIVTVAVASNFLVAAEGIAEDWSATTGHSVRLIPGSSGKHVSMIVNGGPVDLFLSADAARPDALDAAGLVRRRATYAIGRLVVWAPGSGDPMARLLAGEFQRMAIADAALAPYGVAAEQVLTSLGLDRATAAKRVTGENIGQTFGFVATGNAEIGLVALSQIKFFAPAAPADWIVLDDALHAPIRQDMVLLPRAGPAAEALFEHLLSDRVQDVIVGYGYAAPAP
jgi:molybdate transport system substrate-binding protein